ncbi:hypothetical protein P8629_02675 [Hydrogenovibrio sp. 3SP14C1]|uniref:hypothetical protein n=1 Tax=Hydrogenovibrio sp. 3SP14C1 TaxID=3038774 RepID=UPI0002D9084A|nr:hypothetical protein [Hydrogenovibrio sp. 3SP14C1]MDG4811901.1 hypothetical protein [Hydrogenovibrio sp. 3SP14C1]
MEATTVNDYPNIEDEEWRLFQQRNRTHQPKAENCLRCVHFQRKCDHLDFEQMPVIETRGNESIVQCMNFTVKQ